MDKSSSSISDLSMTLSMRIVLPCFPIFIERFIVFMVPHTNIEFPNRDVLIVAFLVPFAWLIEIQNKVVRLFAGIFFMLGLLPFICSLFSQEPTVYYFGFALTLLSIVTFTSIEIYTFFSGRRELKVTPIRERPPAVVNETTVPDDTRVDG